MKKLISRNVHFLGSKIRAERKALNLTLEDLSIRCIQINPNIAPSISYLSLIETGNRIPSMELLKLFSEIFQKDHNWFLDNATDINISKNKLSKYSFETIDFEPNFLFSKNLIKKAIPALLSQTGVSGRQFAHILIRAYQEKNFNQFPDIERIAESVGKRKFPLRKNDLFTLYKNLGLKIKWFSKQPFTTDNDFGHNIKSTLRSFYGPKNTIYLNDILKKNSARLKYDLALYIGHKILHNGDGQISNHASGGEVGGSPRPFKYKSEQIKQKDILYAWRDFECSFFAGSLLCARMPLRRYLSSKSYDIFLAKKLGVTSSLLMRRMTVVSPYKYWHYFDAYAPGYLRAVYRGNGIKMPWGNIRLATNPCSQWEIFKMLAKPKKHVSLYQLSILKDKNLSSLYSSISINVRDISNTPHVLCLGVDLGPLLKKQVEYYDEFINEIENDVLESGGSMKASNSTFEIIQKISRILNIKWIKKSAENPIEIICPSSANCPRPDKCDKKKSNKKMSWINQIKEDIIKGR